MTKVTRGRKRIEIGQAPWFDQECKCYRQATFRELKQYRKYNDEAEKEFHLALQRQNKSLLKQKRVTILPKSETAYLPVAMIPEHWNLIKRSTRNTIPQPDISIYTWKTHFQNLFQNNRNLLSSAVFNDEDTIFHDVLYASILFEEIRHAIRKIRVTKAPGLDGIPGGCYKVAEEKIIPFLKELFDIMFNTHIFPQSWSRSVIIPIDLHIRAGTTNPDNYRGISLINVLTKIFTSIMASRLQTWTVLENKICVEQAGFRHGYSTIDHVFTLYCIILSQVYGDRRGKLYVAFVDYSKAFDSVDCNQL